MQITEVCKKSLYYDAISSTYTRQQVSGIAIRLVLAATVADYEFELGIIVSEQELAQAYPR